MVFHFRKVTGNDGYGQSWVMISKDEWWLSMVNDKQWQGRWAVMREMGNWQQLIGKEEQRREYDDGYVELITYPHSKLPPPLPPPTIRHTTPHNTEKHSTYHITAYNQSLYAADSIPVAITEAIDSRHRIAAVLNGARFAMENVRDVVACMWQWMAGGTNLMQCGDPRCTNACRCTVCMNLHSLCACSHSPTLVPMDIGMRCCDSGLQHLISHHQIGRLFLCLLFNVLSFFSLLGPVSMLDCFLCYHQCTFVLCHLVFILSHQPDLSNWDPMMPCFVVRAILNVLPLDCDLFSNGFNNVFRKFVCDPTSPCTYISPMIDAYAQIADYTKPLRALCNPPFSHSCFFQLAECIKERMKHANAADLLLLYVGQPTDQWHVGHEEGWALHLATATPGMFPFAHPIYGLLDGFPRTIELWILRNYVCYIELLNWLRFTHINHRLCAGAGAGQIWEPACIPASPTGYEKLALLIALKALQCPTRYGMQKDGKTDKKKQEWMMHQTNKAWYMIV